MLLIAIKLPVVVIPDTLIPDESTVTAVPTLRLDAVTIPTFRLGVPDKPKDVVAKETEEIPVRFAPEPIKLVAVITPTTLIPDELTVTAVPTLKVDAVTIPTFRLGVPDSPKEVVANDAVDAVPTKPTAVTIPVSDMLFPKIDS